MPAAAEGEQRGAPFAHVSPALSSQARSSQALGEGSHSPGVRKGAVKAVSGSILSNASSKIRGVVTRQQSQAGGAWMATSRNFQEMVLEGNRRVRLTGIDENTYHAGQAVVQEGANGARGTVAETSTGTSITVLVESGVFTCFEFVTVGGAFAGGPPTSADAVQDGVRTRRAWKEAPPHVIRPDSKLAKLVLSALQLGSAEAIVVAPMMSAFSTSELHRIYPVLLFDAAFEMFFVLIFVVFNTLVVYVDDDSDAVRPSMILRARSSFSSHGEPKWTQFLAFWLTLVSFVPTLLLVVGGWSISSGPMSNPGLRALWFLRLGRVLYLKVSGYTDHEGAARVTHGNVPHLVGLIRLMVMVLSMCHVFGCLWYLVMRSSGGLDWHVEEEIGYEEGTSFFALAFRDGSMVLASMGLPNASNDTERVGLAILAPLGQLFMAYVFAELVLLATRLSIMSNRKHETEALILAASAQLKLPWHLRHRIKSFHAFQAKWHDFGIYEILLKDLPRGMIAEIKLEVFGAVFQNTWWLADLPRDVINDLVCMFKEEIRTEKDILCRYQEIGKEMFFVVHGVCEVYSGVAPYPKVAEKSSGQYFGELALVTENARRNAWVVTAAGDFCLVAKLDKSSFDQVFSEDEKKKFYKKYQEMTAQQQQKQEQQKQAQPVSISAISLASPAVVTAADHGLLSGGSAAISGVKGKGWETLLNTTHIVSLIDEDNFELREVDTGDLDAGELDLSTAVVTCVAQRRRPSVAAGTGKPRPQNVRMVADDVPATIDEHDAPRNAEWKGTFQCRDREYVLHLNFTGFRERGPFTGVATEQTFGEESIQLSVEGHTLAGHEIEFQMSDSSGGQRFFAGDVSGCWRTISGKWRKGQEDAEPHKLVLEAVDPDLSVVVDALERQARDDQITHDDRVAELEAQLGVANKKNRLLLAQHAGNQMRKIAGKKAKPDEIEVSPISPPPGKRSVGGLLKAGVTEVVLAKRKSDAEPADDLSRKVSSLDARMEEMKAQLPQLVQRAVQAAIGADKKVDVQADGQSGEVQSPVLPGQPRPGA
uniref:Cyclic nucleotide-binding domain-containing protein n=1 Tax=Oxyrrhis marina TaxID=2969 RepID=A0A7S4GQK3_OXYMA